MGLDRRCEMWKPPARGRLVQTTWELRPSTATLIGTASSSTKMPREMRMNVRLLAAAVLVAALAVVGVGASGASGGQAADTLTVWLQVDAQSGWPEVVAAATAQFKAQNPGWDVDVQYQTWPTHLSRFDAALAGGRAPDVKEMGNTEMTKYMAAGAFRPSAVSFPNKARGFRAAASGRVGGKSTASPTTRARLSSRPHGLYRQAGEDPTSIADFTAGRGSSPPATREGVLSVYIAGTTGNRDELRARPRRQDRDHGRASGSGSWTSPRALAVWPRTSGSSMQRRGASKTTDEARPQPYDVLRRATLRRSSAPGFSAAR